MDASPYSGLSTIYYVPFKTLTDSHLIFKGRTFFLNLKSLLLDVGVLIHNRTHPGVRNHFSAIM